MCIFGVLKVSVLFQIVGSVVDFHDELSFINNSVQDSAQLSLLSFGQVRLMHGLNMTFQGNTGRYRYTLDICHLSISPLVLYSHTYLCAVCYEYISFNSLCIFRFGASILVDSPQSLDAFNKLMFNPRCFVLYNDSIPPSEWTNVS